MTLVNEKVSYGGDDADIFVPGTPEATGVLVNNNNNNSVVNNSSVVPGGVGQGILVQVVAPSDLPAGYQLQVMTASGQQQFVTVPEGGVRQGQSFQAVAVGGGGTTLGGGSSSMAGKMPVSDNNPIGAWRDGLCDCCTLGCFHPMFWLGWCFEPVLVGQVMTRMSRDMFGGRGPRPSMSNTCKTMTGIFLFAVLVQIALSIVMDTQSCFGAQEQHNEETLELEILCPDGTIVEPSTVYSAVRSVTSLVSLAFMIYVLIATCRTRQAMRKKYKIEPTCCGGCEDCCCSFWCSCCTVQQMARHTNDYSQFPVKCCSSDCCNKRGQPVEVPEIEL